MMSTENQPKVPPHLQKLLDKVSKNTEAQIEGLVLSGQQTPQTLSTTGSQLLALDLIDANPLQPRRDFDAQKISELADSIAKTGQIEPIVVRPYNGRFQLVVGERRLRACKQLGQQTIKAEIVEVNDEMSAVMALAENIDREDLSDYEIGIALHSIQNAFKSKVELAKYIGKTRGDLYRFLAFVDLPDWIKQRLDQNPRLINRTNAQSLNALLAEADYSEEVRSKAINTVLDMVENNVLTQTMLIAQIKKILRESNAENQPFQQAVKKHYLVDGKKAGQFSFDQHKLSINIAAEFLTDVLAQEIHDWVAAKIAKRAE